MPHIRRRRTRPSPSLRFLLSDLFDLPATEQLKIDLSGLGLACILTPLSVAQGFASGANFDGGDLHPGWLPTIEQVKFSQSPSKQALADGLRRLAATGQAPVSHFHGRSLSWVFESCLSFAHSSADLDKLAERAATGDLGDLPEWLAAETRWKERGATFDDLLYLTDERWPFDREIAERGFPIAAVDHFSPEGATVTADDFLARVSAVPRVERTLAPLLLHLLLPRHRPIPGGSISPQLATRLLRLKEGTNIASDSVLLLAQLTSQDPRWLDVLDEIGRTHTNYLYYYSHDPRLEEIGLRALADLFSRHPERMGLLPLIATGLSPYGFNPWGGPKLTALDLPRVRFEQYNDPKLQWAAVILELTQGGLRPQRAGELAEITARLKSQGVPRLQDALTALARYERFDEATDHYLLKLRRLLSDADWADQSAVVGTLNDSLRRRSSGVIERRVWRSLALPEKLLDLVSISRP